MGRGADVGADLLMAWNSGAGTNAVQALAFSTGLSSVGEFQFNELQGTAHASC